MGDYEAVKSDFTAEELEKLEKNHQWHCFTNSLVDFHESDEEDDDGETIFAYTQNLRYV